MTALAGWENFYVIVGSSAGALVGRQLVRRRAARASKSQFPGYVKKTPVALGSKY